jgi:GLPGLI family protein
MKKLALASLAGIAGLALFAFSLPESSFEGVITYSMSFGSSASASPQAEAMMQGSNRIIYIKGSKVRTDVNTSMYKSVTIADRQTKVEVTMVDMMGTKYEIKADPNKAKATDDKPEIKYIDSTKTIAGYKCKAAVVTVMNKRDGQSYSSTVFYTDQLPYSEDMGQYKGLKGYPLQFGLNQQGMNISIVAQTIEKKALSDTLFTIPTKGYKVVSSREEMMKDIQEQNSGAQ